ncbi:MAG: hypothetical protein R3345_07860 [Fulvivirga sp.]|nr:hypothetical protein [Fulvivirga sp.]
MQTKYHDLIVKVDKRLVESIKMGQTQLKLAADFDIYKNTKITAEVVSVPHKLKGIVLYGEDEGFPPYQGRFTSDGKRYPTIHQRKYITMENQPIDIEVGDTVYFHYLTLSDHNYVGKDRDGMELYKCGYDQVFCYVRDGQINMVNGYIAVSALKDDSYEEIEIDKLDTMGKKVGTKKIEVKMTEGGIIYDMDNKPVFRHGKISHIGKSPDLRNYEVSKGSTIVYSDWSEFKNTIEGTEYYIMKVFDVVAFYQNNQLVPSGFYCSVSVESDRESKLILPKKYKKKNNVATILKTGSFVQGLQAGQHVYVLRSEVYTVPIEGEKISFLKEQYVWGIKKAG